MKLEANWDRLITVSLSRRNLEGLLAQLDTNESTSDTSQIMRRDGDTLLIVVAEENEKHYGDRPAGASGPGQRYGERIS